MWFIHRVSSVREYWSSWFLHPVSRSITSSSFQNFSIGQLMVSVWWVVTVFTRTDSVWNPWKYFHIYKRNLILNWSISVTYISTETIQCAYNSWYIQINCPFFVHDLSLSIPMNHIYWNVKMFCFLCSDYTSHISLLQLNSCIGEKRIFQRITWTYVIRLNKETLINQCFQPFSLSIPEQNVIV